MSGADAPTVSISEIARRLKIAGIETASLEARLLVALATSCSSEELHGSMEVTVTAGQRQFLDDLVARRINREPMAYLMGIREFWSLPFKVAPGVLIPRPDSETVIEAACRARPDRTAALRILDLGTGTGCLLLALLREYPHAVGVGVDLSPLAVETARENAQALGMEARARFMPLDWNDRADPLYANLYAARFDIIVSNPPYIATGEIETLMRDVLDYEPRVALEGGLDGLDAYRRILPVIRAALAEQGVAILECGDRQAGELIKLARDQGFVEGLCALDLSGVERCVILGLEGEKNLLERKG